MHKENKKNLRKITRKLRAKNLVLGENICKRERVSEASVRR